MSFLRNPSTLAQACVLTAMKVTRREMGTHSCQKLSNASVRRQRRGKDPMTNPTMNTQRNHLGLTVWKQPLATVVHMQTLVRQYCKLYFLLSIPAFLHPDWQLICFVLSVPVALLHLPAFQKMGDALFQNHPT